ERVLRETYLRQMRLVPGAVAIVATASGDERTGLAATAWTSVSADPPMLLVCVNRSASAYPLVMRARAFSVNMLADAHSETVAIFSAQRELEGRERFLDGEWIDGTEGQPILRDAVASF